MNPNSILWSHLADAPEAQMGNMNPTTRQPSNELDRQAFLNLLMTQLKFQDPLNPMDDRDFMAQMAQFSALEQMVNLNQTFERSQAFGMIGRTVDFSFRHAVTGEWVDGFGTVQAVTTQGGEAFLLVDGMDVPLHGVNAVGDDFVIGEQLDDLFALVNHNRIQDLVGRYIQALLHGADGQITEFVEGQVDYVKISGRNAVLVVGNREVFPGEVASIAAGPILIGATAFTNGDRLTRVDIRNGRAYLIFDGDTRVHIERINYAMEALKYMGQQITHGSISGTVRDITIRESVPFFNVRVPGANEGEYTIEEVSYLLYLADRLAS